MSNSRHGRYAEVIVDYVEGVREKVKSKNSKGKSFGEFIVKIFAVFAAIAWLSSATVTSAAEPAKVLIAHGAPFEPAPFRVSFSE